MSLQQYEDFVFNSVHAHEKNPIKFWKQVEQDQQKAVDFMKGKNQVILRGPNVDLTLSVKGLTFMNSLERTTCPTVKFTPVLLKIL